MFTALVTGDLMRKMAMKVRQEHGQLVLAPPRLQAWNGKGNLQNRRRRPIQLATTDPGACSPSGWIRKISEPYCEEIRPLQLVTTGPGACPPTYIRLRQRPCTTSLALLLVRAASMLARHALCRLLLLSSRRTRRMKSLREVADLKARLAVYKIDFEGFSN